MGNVCGGAKNAPTATQSQKSDINKLLEDKKTTVTAKQTAKQPAASAKTPAGAQNKLLNNGKAAAKVTEAKQKSPEKQPAPAAAAAALLEKPQS